jgi:hypothetical protein
MEFNRLSPNSAKKGDLSLVKIFQELEVLNVPKEFSN